MGDPAERARELGIASAAVRNCGNCALGMVTTPLPFSSPFAPILAVLGGSVTREDVLRREVFSDRTSQVLKRMLREVGIDPGTVAYVNSVNCRGEGNILLEETIAACRPNIQLQLEAVKPKYLLVLGDIALGYFFPGMRLEEMRGKWWRVNLGKGMIWAISSFPPVSIKKKKMLEDDLDQVKFYMQGVFDPIDSGLCVVCDGVPVSWHRGVGFCEKHSRKVVGGRVKKVKQVEELF